MILFHILSVLCLIFALTEAKSIKKSHANLLEPTFGLDDWQGKWFPYAPGEPHILKNVQRVQPTTGEPTTSSFKDDWKGKWFPYGPGEPHIIKMTPEQRTEVTEPSTTEATTTEDSKGKWQGKWFPQGPNEPHKSEPKDNRPCDDGKVGGIIFFLVILFFY